MPSLFRSAAAVAFAGIAVANPVSTSANDACLAAVTGTAALGDANLRKEHCSSFIKTIVTPAAVTVTTTITDAPSPSGWNAWKRDVTVCPNEVPNYASACDEAGYKSACGVFGVTGETTVTIPATTTTKTVYVGGGGSGYGNGNGNGNGYGDGVCTSTSTVLTSVTKTGCSGGMTTSTVTETSTSTVTKAATTVTVTPTYGSGGPSPSGQCLSDSKAQEFVDAFTDLLEYTSYNGTQGPPGRGYHFNVSAKYLAVDFKDYSDSINWMANLPLGGVTFDSRAAFDQGQGLGQPELKVTTILVNHGCKTVTWKWNAITATGASVMGINHMIINDDLTQIQVNHAEFDNAAWLYSFGLQCKVPSTTSKRSILY